MSDAPNANAHAREAIDRLPDDATWDDVMYELYGRESIDAGLADVAAGRTIPQDQVKAHVREYSAARREPTGPLVGDRNRASRGHRALHWAHVTGLRRAHGGPPARADRTASEFPDSGRPVAEASDARSPTSGVRPATDIFIDNA